MSDSGNFVSEWFGHRVYPSVSKHEAALLDQEAQRCPFLTVATREDRRCIKAPAALGVCTISSASNGARQDWLVCPYRAVEISLVGDVVQHLFGPTGDERIIIPAPKFQIGSLDSCAGCVLALPQSVWDSWQRHLGAPELIARGDGHFELKRPGTGDATSPPAWIYIFDIDSTSELTPNPIVIRQRIATDADSIAYFALKVAPALAVAQGGSGDRDPVRIRQRLARWWPELWGFLPSPL